MLSRNLFVFAAAACLLLDAAGPVLSQKKEAAKLAKTRSMLSQTVSIEGFHDGKKLSEILKEFSAKGIPLRLDERAFGDRLDEINDLTVRFPQYPRQAQVGTILRLIFEHIAVLDVAVDYRVLPKYVLITTREQALEERTHDLSELLKVSDRLPAEFQQAYWGNDHPTAFILEQIEPKLYRGPIRLMNGNKIVVCSNEEGHREIEGMIDAYRRLADLAVLMNARLIEVEGDYYGRALAPLLGKRVARVSADVVKELGAARLVLKGDPLKLRPNREVLFLSLHNLINARPVEGPAVHATYGAYLEGVSFRVVASPDDARRRLRLKLIEESAELVEMRRKMVHDLVSGKDVEVEYPDLKRRRTVATIEIEDLQAVLVEVGHRPFPAAKDTRLVLLLEPRIYIAEEEAALRAGRLRPLPLR